jgi:hypothetical protein
MTILPAHVKNNIALALEIAYEQTLGGNRHLCTQVCAAENAQHHARRRNGARRNRCGDRRRCRRWRDSNFFIERLGYRRAGSNHARA